MAFLRYIHCLYTLYHGVLITLKADNHLILSINRLLTVVIKSCALNGYVMITLSHILGILLRKLIKVLHFPIPPNQNLEKGFAFSQQFCNISAIIQCDLK